MVGPLLVLAPHEVGSEVLARRDVQRVGEAECDRDGQGDQEAQADQGADQGVTTVAVRRRAALTAPCRARPYLAPADR